MSFWDEQFSGDTFKYGLAPNVFLTEQAARFAPGGRVLVPGDGEGRNGVWLAEQGHQVTAVDQSAVGLAKAQAWALQRGVALSTLQADLAIWQPTPADWDAVVLTYVHLPAELRGPVHRRLATALKPGGWLLLEAFHPQQLGRPSGGPKQPDMLYTAEQLEADFADCFDTQIVETLEVVLDEGRGHQGPAWVTRYLGQRC